MPMGRRLMGMKDEKKQEKPSFEEQAKLYMRLKKEGRLPLDTDTIIASYPQKSRQQKKD
jgi:hypothetical protein